MHRRSNSFVLLFFATLAAAISIAACTEPDPLRDPAVTEPENHVFYDEYDSVWRAIQLAVRKYPVRLNNIESGILETDYIKGDKIFVDPSEGGPPPSAARYKINIRAIKGKDEGKGAVKVVITKVTEIQPDFFTGFKEIPTDGLEERTIMYRVGRFLDLDKKLSQVK